MWADVGTQPVGGTSDKMIFTGDFGYVAVKRTTVRGIKIVAEFCGRANVRMVLIPEYVADGHGLDYEESEAEGAA